MRFVNLTPHALTLQLPDGSRQEIAPSGMVARVASTSVEYPTVGGMPVYRTVFGAIEGLPLPEEGMAYIVSALVLGRTTRTDVYGPGTGPNDGAIRYADGPRKGQVEAVTRLVQN